MKKCSNCGAEIDENSTFCPACGKKQENDLENEITCQKCGFKNDKNNKFCQKCGSPLASNDQSNNDNTSTKAIIYTYCPNCGFKNESGNKFCQKCGSLLDTKGENQNKNEFNNNSKKLKQAYNESGNPGFSNSLKIWDKYLKLKRKTSKDEVLKYCMGRADYWYVMLPIIIFLFILESLGYGAFIADILIIRYCAIPTINRLHDAGYNGNLAYLFIPSVVGDAIDFVKIWKNVDQSSMYQLIAAFSLICIVILIFFLCKKTNWNETKWMRK